MTSWMRHGLGDCTPEQNCGCYPPSVPAPTRRDDTNDVCECGHFQGWHDPISGHVGMCLWPNGWPDKRECKCDSFKTATKDTRPPVSDIYGVAPDYTTPAASVPAADILALADWWHDLTEEWFDDDRRSYGRATQLHVWIENRLRTLVAAAEQADKGEAADTPRDEQHRSWCSAVGPDCRCLKIPDPAAPPEDER